MTPDRPGPPAPGGPAGPARRPRWQAYAAAIGAVGGALALRLALANQIAPVYVLLSPVVMLVALLGGLGPGLLATFLATLGSVFLILPAETGTPLPSSQDAAGAALFAALGASLSVVAHRHARTRTRLAALERDAAVRQASAQLQAAEDTLAHTRAAARLTAAQLEAIIQSMADAMAIFDPAGRLVLTNVAQRVAATASEGAAPLTDFAALAARFELLDADGHALPVAAWPASRVLRGETVTELELCRRPRDGGPDRCVSFSGRPVRDAQGRVSLAVVVSRDVTQRRQAEAELRRSREELRALAARLQAVREQEKARIARDLHDDLGQLLTGLQFDLRWLERALEAMEPSERLGPLLDRLVAASELAGSTVATVQRITQDLRPAALDRIGLPAALQQEVRRFGERTGLRATIAVEAEPDLSEEAATTLYRICQEALTNVARHAGAAGVAVRLREEAGAVVLEVEDDGRGLPAGCASSAASLGLVGMRERARAAGGEVTFADAAGHGTLVVARLPRPPRGDPT